MSDDHSHDDRHDAPLSGPALRVKALESLLVEKGLVDSKTLDGLPKPVAEFAAAGGAAVWDFHVSDKVLSPTIRRAHPQPARAKS